MVYDYEYFKSAVLKMISIDLNAYKERQMKRRIDTLIAKNGFDGYEKYVQALRTDARLLDEFINYLTINVSEFYRNPDQWRILEDQIVPEMIKKFGSNLKVWSAACSTGDEPYSLVMALSRHISLSKIKIIATDIDKQVIQRAKEGLYVAKSIAAVPEDLKKRYFVPEGSAYRISDDIKKCVEFKEHDLLKDPYPSDCHIIVCRNVLIYFTEEAKEIIYRNFYKALKKGGKLFVGSTEQILDYKEIGYTRDNSFFYEKI